MLKKSMLGGSKFIDVDKLSCACADVGGLFILYLDLLCIVLKYFFLIVLCFIKHYI